jgi:acyl transferase domain-containing protein/acyl carrier protein
MKTQVDEVVEALRASLKENQRLRQAYQRLAGASADPVAVVAMGCRFPSGVASPEDLWELVRSGRDAISGFPADRGWDTTDAGYARAGGFIDGADEFDAGFFGISPREALATDPQQRLLLEVCWEAFERAGIDPHSLRGSRTGVFAGTNGQDYAGVLAAQDAEGYVATGNAASVVSGRVSYVLGLEGPAVTVDTACSSALVALHLACQALRAGECDLALAGGVTVMATPALFTEFAVQSGLAADGRCKAFGAGADGTGWAEGAGVLLVERLSDARRLGHPVLAIVRGSAVNSDGASNGLTAPNGPSQQRAIRAALANAGVAADEVDVVEGHGTGTVLGDPIEAQALIATYGQGRSPDRPLWLGSVKSNIGHTQAAAGAAGAIKMIMALGAGVLPPTLHAGEPSAHVNWSAGAVRLLTEERDWSASEGRPRRAGVSSFGVSGTNAHVIFEEPGSVSPAPLQSTENRSRGPVPWVVSGRGDAGLRGQAGRLAGFARSGCGGGTVTDVGWSLAAARAIFTERAVVLAPDAAGFAAGLEAVAAGEPADGVVAGQVPEGGPGKVVFVFSGQGGQWAGMAAGLAGSCPAFAAKLAECAAALQPHVDWPVTDVLAGTDPDALERVDVVQPALWAVMVALAAAWDSVGVTPDAVAGHSQGEIAAATVAGTLTVEQAARVVAVRSQALVGLPDGGAMVAVAWSAQVAREQVAGQDGRIWVAAVNSPGSMVLAGDREALARVVAVAEAEGVRVRWLPVSYASHGPDVDAVAADLGRDLAGIMPVAGTVPFWSAVTGAAADGSELDGSYWVSNLRQQVRFEEVIRGLADSGHGVFIEVSPHPVLVTAMEETLGQRGTVVTGTLRRDDGGPERLRTSAAEVFVRGVDVDWTKVFDGSGARRVDLPTYAFQRQRYWPGRRPGGGDVRGAGLTEAGHPLLAAAVRLAGEDGVLFTGRLSVAESGWLGDHAVFGTVLVPGTAALEMASWAGALLGCPLVAEFTLEAPLILPADGGIVVQLRVAGAEQDGNRPVSLYSRADTGDEWVRHASGMLTAEEPAPDTAELAGPWPPPGAVPVPVDGWYDRLARQGYGYGPAFRGLTGAWRRGADVYAEVRLPEDQPADRFSVHPALLDAALHAAGFLTFGQQPDEGERGLVPFSWGGARVAGRGARALRVRLRPAGDDTVAVLATDADGNLVLAAERLVLRPVSPGQLRAAGAGVRDGLLAIEWVPVTGTAAGAGRWAVLGGDDAATTGLTSAGIAVKGYPDLAALVAAAAGGEPVPPIVIAWLPGLAGGTAGLDTASAVRAAARVALGLVQAWLARAEFARSVLAVVTSQAVATGPGAEAGDPAWASIWGLIRSAQAENPGQLLLADVDGLQASWQALAGAARWGEPELVIRRGRVLGRRLTRMPVPTGDGPGGDGPAGGLWRLDPAGTGTLGGVRRVPNPDAGGPLRPGQVRIAVRTAGLNFRDVLVTLGTAPPPAEIGGEGAGVVTETGPGVVAVTVGDRVLGIWDRGLGPVAIADERMIVKIPAGWSFTQAASVPVVFATAYYGLVDLAGLRAGESVLIHAAAGGVGMAAAQLARYLGAQVFATASPGKQAAVRELGVDRARIASSRTTEFAARFRDATGGRGVDVVLDSLAGEFVDASLGLLASGGRFIELGKADIRDPADVAARWPGVSYQVFNLPDRNPGRTSQILATVLDMFRRGVLTPLPVRAWELDRAGEALRFMGQGRHTGKNVVRVPAALDGSGTVLITGGSGVLAGLTARHLVAGRRAGRLILASRRGPAAPGMSRLAADLAGAGADVHVCAGDVADRQALAGLLGQIPASHPLTGVIHTAATLDDGVVEALTPDRVDVVLRPKADAAIVLDELTAGLELSAFVLFSSAAATFGSAGQGNYAVANAFLDALAQDRRARGLPATSIGWGMWEQATGLTAHLGEAGRGRSRGGVLPLATAQGLELLDAALAADAPVAVAVGMDLAALRAQAGTGTLPPLWHGMVRIPARPQPPAPGGGPLRERLAGLAEADQGQLVLDLVREQAAAVLGHASADPVRPGAAFRDLGFDSLTAIELRNRLAAVTGLRLAATLAFDHPTPQLLAAWLRIQVLGRQAAAAPVPTSAAEPVMAGDPVALVAMGCRFPGGVASPADLWELMRAGTDAVSGFPVGRGWDRTDGEFARLGGFVFGVEEFDAGFFGISPREALGMDPQQRLLLEVCWEAIERAGIDPHTLRGSRTGVFAGTSSTEYPSLLTQAVENTEGYILTGNAPSVVSGRVSYVLGLEGPAVSVDTACSSSLVALHLACQALRAGECDLALAGGVSVLATVGVFGEFAAQSGLAADGRCKAFGASADGIGWAEGAGVLLVERLSDARRNGHPVLAVVRGSALNQDGASNGLTAPSGPAQQRVIRAALASAGVAAGDVDVVEAHGTGTVLGDPIEAQALIATYGQDRDPDRPLWLGSVKSNIGHTQAAAGAAGVIKMALALREGVLPCTLHADEPSSHVDWSAGAVRVLTSERDWPVGEGRPRRAGVSSFGISGTNAHVILEEASPGGNGGAGSPPVRWGGLGGIAPPGETAPPETTPWVLSGWGDAGLRGQAGRLAGFARAGCGGGTAADVGWSLAVGRSVFPERAVVLAGDPAGFAAGLAAVAAGQPAGGVVAGRAPDGGPGKVVFVFPGQGGQWVEMAAGLAGSCPAFASRLAECGAALQPHVDWPVADVLAGADAGALERVEVVQPALWAVMVALAAAWEFLGVVPDAVAGHSQGEIAAATVAGILTVEQAARVVAVRSKVLAGLPDGGVMVAVGWPAQVAREQVAGQDGRIWVAAVNSPGSVVLSGDREALARVVVAAEAEGVRVRWLPVSYASHGPGVDAVAAGLGRDLAGITPVAGAVPFWSAVTGAAADGAGLDGSYWVANLREQVRFEDVIGGLAGSGFGVFIEVSPHPVLVTAVEETLGQRGTVVAGTLRRDDGGRERLLASAAEVFVRGVDVDWAKVFDGSGARRVELPTYAFQRQRYWPTPRPDAVGVPVIGWRYRVTWQPVTEIGDSTVLTGRWLLVCPVTLADSPLAMACGQVLTGGGAEAMTVETVPADLDRHVLARKLRHSGEVAGVVSLLALDEGAGLAGTLVLLQALGDAGIGARLWVLTSGAAVTGGQRAGRLVQAQVWGLGRVAALEHPRRWGGLVDVPAVLTGRAIGWLRAVLAGHTGEDQVAIGQAGVLVRRLVPAPAPVAPAQPWRPSGPVLITGGTGALGPVLARWLAGRGAPHVILVSRRGVAAPAMGALAAELCGRGTAVTVAACDVADRADLAGLLARLGESGTAVRCVVHAAVGGRLTALDHLGLAELAEVCAAKVTGAANLDELLGGSVDTFLMFSSIAGVWGSGKHGAYAAANAYLDALAVHRRARGLAGTSVPWGVWRAGQASASGGSAVDFDPGQLIRQGLPLMLPERALTGLQQILDGDETCTAFAEVDWRRFVPVFTAARPSPLLTGVPQARALLEQDSAPVTPVGHGVLASQLAKLSGAEQERLVLDRIREQAASVLGHASAEAIRPGAAFRDLGFDSLTAVELRDKLATVTGLRLPATMVFDYPTPQVLARWLHAQVTGVQLAVPVAAGPAVAADPVAVVAMGCRYPGGVASPEDLWELVRSGTDAVSAFPADRGWDGADAEFARLGGFIYGAGEFDAGFFGISPREALAMDPQQRLLLETCWETVERAGIDPVSLRGSRTGVYAGTSSPDYPAVLARADDGTEGYVVIGNASSVVSGRVSYVLGLEGPAVSVDTACSSALVALHLACQALRAGECDLALAGGVAVIATPAVFGEFARQAGLASDGRCKAFGAGADGMGMAEGVGVLLVERLSDAQRNGHPVLAVIAGSAVNSDGASNGLTAPNGPSQQRVIRAALASAGLSAADVDAVEAHGTGTRLGDPIEAQALLATYGQDRPEDRPLWLGSVKSNIGHTQAAAGAAGVIKTVMALRAGILTRTLHADEPSPHVDWSSGAVRLLTQEQDWPDEGRPRRAGVSSFGISGTNAHLLLEQGPAEEPRRHGGAGSPSPGGYGGAGSPPVSRGGLGGIAPPEATLPWVVSGRGEAGLRGHAGRLAGFARAGCGGAGVNDVGWSLASGRSVFTDRAVVLAEDAAGFAAALEAVAAGEPAPGVVAGRAPDDGPGKVAFVFAGQGSQRSGMGLALAEAFPVFGDAVAEVCGHLDPLLDRSVAQTVFAGPGSSVAGLVDQTVFTQAGLFAMQVGLARLFQSWGITPDYVTGHSIGEIAAAHVAGVFCLADACALVAARGRLMQALGGGGAMAAIAAGEEEVTAELAGVAAGVAVAAVNGPRSVVVSGAAAEVAAVGRLWRGRGVRVRRLRTSHAFHSPLVEPMLAELGAVAAGLTYAAPSIPVVCSVTGQPDAGLMTTSTYWVRQAREAVRFADCVRWLDQAGAGVLAELGGDGTLSSLAGDDGGTWVPTLRVGRSERMAVLSAAARVFVAGVSVDWAAMFTGARRVDLPTYAFQRRRYWPDIRPALPVAGGDGAEAGFWAAVDRQDVAALAGTVGVRGDEPLGELLPVLAAWRRRGQRQSVVAGWRYQVTWQPVTGLAGDTMLSGRWLLVVPAGLAAGEQAASEEVLAGGGGHVVTVIADDVSRPVLADRLRDAGGQELAGVVSLLALAGAGAAGTLLLVQALGDAGIDARLWVLTRGAVTAGDQTARVNPAQAMVWGLGRVCGLEHPRRWGGLIDLPATLTRRCPGWLREILADGTGEDQVAVRDGGVLARRLARAPAATTTRAWRPSGPVLITGGTGALGGHVARWLVSRGAPRIILASRRGIAAEGAAALAARVARAGSAVTVVVCDVSDRADLTANWRRLDGVRAVVHAAGAGQATKLAEMSLAEFAAITGGKTEGALLLDELAGGEAEAFVLFSSISATWGSSGQAAYAAANACLDALAEDRRARGLTATSVGWGPWRGGGMAQGEIGPQLRRWGLRSMAPRLAIAALAQAVDRGETCVSVADVDWRRFVRAYTIARPSPLLTGVAEAREAAAAGASAPAATGRGGAFTGRLAGLAAADQERVLLEVICERAAAVLGHDSADPVRPGAVFRDLGFDSLTAVEFRDQLGTATGLALPATLVFDYPTPAVLAGWLRAEITGVQTAGPLVAAPGPVTGDPVAIVAMGCRLPGGVASPDDLWELVRSATDATGGFPADRGWEDAGGEFARAGGFVYGAGEFDAGFFGISPREALAMDPQQRMLLEVCWEALERGGIDPVSLRGSRTGVFAGTTGQDYATVLTAEDAEGYLATGSAASVMSGRVSYVLGLEGPAVSVDTACSSSLVALHLACQALRAGECDLALAGGVTVMATPGVFGEFAVQGGLAADGRCKAFGAAADGMGWGEGVGLLVVERLSDAWRNGHPVLAVVAGSAVNSDGASNGLTAPNGPSQQRVIRAALASAGLSAADVDVVEAHGTGTVLGDPIEAQALIATYGQGRDQDRPLWLGSIKSNIGHAQAAAGAAGVIKMVMALRHRVLPRTLHADEPSPHIDWSAGTVRLLTCERDWHRDDARPRRAGVSAFGMSGTNAHVILASPPARLRDADGRCLPSSPETGPLSGDGGANTVQTPARPFGSWGPGPRGPVPWVVSGRGDAGLRGQARRLAGFARAGCGGAGVVDVGWSLAAGRSVFAERAVVLAADAAGFAAGLEAVAAGEPADGVTTGRAPDGGAGKTVFVFPGQGGQWAGMAAELASTCPAFAERLAECVAAMQPHVDWPAAQVLRGADPDLLESADVVQPVLWAVMVALAAAWESVGVIPDAVAGHSQGEIAAAVVAGILPLTEGARIVAVRSKALARLAEGGVMAAVAWSADVAAERLAGSAGRVWVAAVNSPGSVVLAGHRDALAPVLAMAEAEGVRVRWLPVSYASHGPGVDAVTADLARELGEIAPGPGRVPFWSAVTGEAMDGAGLDGAYWVANLRERVRFEQVVRGLAGSGHGAFIEVSPHPVLVTAMEQTLTEDQVVAGTLRRDDGGPGRLLASVAEVFVRGVPVDWAAVFAGSGARRADLPAYAFQHQRYWPSIRANAGDVRGAGLAEAGHPLLAAAVGLAGEDGLLFTGRWSVAGSTWFGDHVVFGSVLVPGAALVEIAAWAGAVAGCPRVRELALETPLVLPEQGWVTVQLRVSGPEPDGSRTVSLYARPDEDDGAGWTRHASGTLAAEDPAVEDPAVALAVEAGLAGSQWPPADAVAVPADGLYDRLAGSGYEYGPTFRGLVAVWRRGDELFADVRLAELEHAAAERYGVHPALLDAALHAAGFLTDADADADAGTGTGAGGVGLVPFSWTGVRVLGRGARALRARLRRCGGGVAVLAADESGQVVVSVDELVLRSVSAGALRTAGAGRHQSLFGVEWVPVSGQAVSGGQRAVQWAVLGGDAAAAAGLGAAGTHAGLAGLIASGKPVPSAVLARLPGLIADTAVRSVAGAVLALIQEWLNADEFTGSVLIIATTQAAAAEPGDSIADLAGAAVWGLVRSAQSEHPGRFVLADVDGQEVSWRALAGAVEWGEPELAIRQGRVLGRRLTRAVLPHDANETSELWRLDPAGDGTLGGVRRVPAPEAGEPLRPGQVRIAVRAAGLNFRDVLVTLGTVPGRAVIGSEGAGVVTETGPGVWSVTVGDRVLGGWDGALGPVAVADERMIAKIPAGWSFAQAVSVPVVFATAYYGLVDLAGLRAGESVLIHAAAGGVGMAAVQLARHLGAEIFATASTPKQPLVAEQGIDPARIASSRTTEFATLFRAATGGRGVDVVLDSMAGEFVDASLGLVAPGGRFIEMGKADIRDRADVAARWPGVSYRAFDLMDAGPERIGEILAIVLDLFERGVLTPLPVRSWELDRVGEALRFMGQGRHVGKNVVRLPAAPDPAGTVLITGGSGVLAGLTARHLAAQGRAGRLLLASRRGPAAPSAARIAADLAGLGARVQVVACDAADRPAMAALLGQVPAAHPLTGVFHTAGVLDDGVVGALTSERLDRVLAPKADAAVVLDELTADRDLSEFVLFSAAAATFGAPGQGNYAAANAFLDALAQQRQARGLAATSIAWGMWEQATGLTAHLGEAGRSRARGGVLPLTSAQGLDLLDAALAGTAPVAVAANVDLAGLRAQARAGTLAPLWRGLVQAPAVRQTGVPAGVALREQLAGLPEERQVRVVLDLVRGQAAAVLGYGSADPVRPGAAFRDLGFDSLTSIELRNRLATMTGLRLPATLVFDHSTPHALAAWLRSAITEDGAASAPAVPVLTQLDKLKSMLSRVTPDDIERARISARLEALLSEWNGRNNRADDDDADIELDAASDSEMFDIIHKEIGIA